MAPMLKEPQGRTVRTLLWLGVHPCTIANWQDMGRAARIAGRELRQEVPAALKRAMLGPKFVEDIRK